ncbi:hypothetical protein EYF80_005593 [Liparis tanakae]|uniref:Uncharacterized protein n=1 Tax=Liparis tanakae TaxID=230148 RepID=A0A4Z2J257_9TELE|nr:hypothetical protein EYF80_005593 [Liparis tanakae]
MSTACYPVHRGTSSNFVVEDADAFYDPLPFNSLGTKDAAREKTLKAPELEEEEEEEVVLPHRLIQRTDMIAAHITTSPLSWSKSAVQQSSTTNTTNNTTSLHLHAGSGTSSYKHTHIHPGNMGYNKR